MSSFAGRPYNATRWLTVGIGYPLEVRIGFVPFQSDPAVNFPPARKATAQRRLAVVFCENMSPDALRRAVHAWVRSSFHGVVFSDRLSEMPELDVEISDDQREWMALVPDPARAVATAVGMLSPGDELVIFWPYLSKMSELDKLIFEAQDAFLTRRAA